MLIVTGAAGFIGANLVAALNAAGRRDIVAVDQPRALAHGGQLKDLQTHAQLPKDDLFAWLEKNARSPGQIEGILHLGACSDTTVTDRTFVMNVNYEYSRRLWEFCAQNRVRYVYASSAATYGDGAQGYDDTADPKRLQPLNLYGESKHLFDLWALEQKQTPPGWAGLKFFNVYGPREQHKARMASMVFHGFNQIRATGKVRLFKSDRPGIPDGGQQRDFIYVKDVVAAALFFLRVPADCMNGLFNIGTGKARSFADLATATFAAMQLPPKIEYIPMPEDLRGKYQYFTQATIGKLRAAGFTQPMHSLEEGVADYVRILKA